MLGNARLPGPFSRVPIAWVIALVVFILAGVSEADDGKSGTEQALILVVVGVLLVVRGALVFITPGERCAGRRAASPATPPATARRLLSRGRTGVAVDVLAPRDPADRHRGEESHQALRPDPRRGRCELLGAAR